MNPQHQPPVIDTAPVMFGADSEAPVYTHGRTPQNLVDILHAEDAAQPESKWTQFNRWLHADYDRRVAVAAALIAVLWAAFEVGARLP